MMRCACYQEAINQTKIFYIDLAVMFPVFSLSNITQWANQGPQTQPRMIGDSSDYFNETESSNTFFFYLKNKVDPKEPYWYNKETRSRLI